MKKKLLCVFALFIALIGCDTDDLGDLSADVDYTQTGFLLADFSADMELPSSDTWIITDAEVTDTALFRGLKDLLEVAYDSNREVNVLFSNLEELVDCAFYVSCSDYVSGERVRLTSIELPSATSIGTGAFFNCDALTSVDLPQVTSIGNYVFGGCLSLAFVDLPLVVSIGYEIFYFCRSLRSVNLGAEGDGLGLANINAYNSFGSYNFSPENIDLRIKLAVGSSFSVDENALIVAIINGNVYRYEFKSITQPDYLMVDRDTLSLEYTQGSQDVVNLATSAARSTIKAVSDNDAFEVSVDGLTVVVEAAKYNYSWAGAIEGNVTITAGEGESLRSVTVAVSQVANGLVVGEVYDDGDDLGVIWWVADDLKSCKILGIQEGGDHRVVYTTLSELVSGAEDYDDGAANTAAIRARDDYSYETYPVMEWIDTTFMNSTEDIMDGTGWYLPARNELITLLPLYYTNSDFQAALDLYDDAIRSEFYWASTISTSGKAWAIKYWAASSYTYSEFGITNTSGRYVRAVKLIRVD